MRSSNTKVVNGPRITVQYRLKDGKVFEITDGALVLAVHISPRHSPVDSGNWHVETRLGTGSGPFLVDAWGATPGDALREVATAWAARTPKLEPFNWEAVTHALHAVHAV